MSSILQTELKANEDCSRGEIWSEQDTRYLISVWADADIQRQLRGMVRNNAVYDEICRRLRTLGVHRTPTQCRNKTKNLRKGFKELKTRTGQCSKSITRQSTIFFKELDKVLGADYKNCETDSKDSCNDHSVFKENQDECELYNGCNFDNASMSDCEAKHGYESHEQQQQPNDDSQRGDHLDIHQPNPYLYTATNCRAENEGFATRDRLDSVLDTLQQLNQDNMDRVKETVIELNQTFLEQQFAAEERREKSSREHEIRLLNMFLKVQERNNLVSQQHQNVYPVQLSQYGIQQNSQQPTRNPHLVSKKSASTTPNSSSSQSLSQTCCPPTSSHEQTSPPTQAFALPACASPLQCLALRLYPGDDIKESLRLLVSERAVHAACVISCVGSVRCAEIRLADSKTILKLTDNHEIVSLSGTISTDGMHLHVSLANQDGKVVGGHVFGKMEVFTTAEIVIGQLPNMVFKRELDNATGYKELVVTEK